MNNGDMRRNRKRQGSSKRYKVRYDRIVAAVLVLIVMIVILTSCVKSCSKDKKDSGGSSSSSTTNSENQTQSSIVDNLQTSDETSSIISSGTGTIQTTAAEFTVESHSFSDVNRGNLVLVNANHEYKFLADDITPSTLYDNIKTEYYSVGDYVIKLDIEVINQLNALMEGFYHSSSNNDIVVIGGYRTLEEQNDKYYGGYSGFKGGFSDYHTGRTFDMSIFPKDGSSAGYYSPSGIYAWIDNYAADYGFIVRFPEGKENYTGEQARTQTYRYIGTPHSLYIKQKGICLEEYIDIIKGYNNTKPLEIASGSKLYHVYYVPANTGADTDVPVPSNKTYTVSGNNVDGFIVTVNMN